MKLTLFITIISVSIINFIIPSTTYAQLGTGHVDVNLQQPQGYGILAFGSSGESLVQTIVLNIIYLFFAVGGIGTLIYFVWGAVDWILSGGDKEKISGARKKMTNAIIGLVLLAMSFVIIRTVGRIAGFDPLGNLQIRGLGNDKDFINN